VRNWIQRELQDDGEVITVGDSLLMDLVILPKDFESQHRLWETLTNPELDNKIQEIKSRGLEGVEVYEVEKYFRYTMPFTVLVLVFIGVIVSSRKVRGGTGLQIALGFIISFIFIIFVGRNTFAVPPRAALQLLLTGVIIALHWLLFFGAARYANASVSLIGLSTTTLWTSFLEPVAYRRRVSMVQVVFGLVADGGRIFSAQPPLCQAFCSAADFLL